MAEAKNKEVKDVERIEIEPTTDDEIVEPAPESSPETDGEAEGKEPEAEPEKKEQLVSKQIPPVEPAPKVQESEGGDDLQEVDGETPKERALRREVTRLRREGRQARASELLGAPPAPEAKAELSPEKRKVLEKYKPEEISALREAIDVLSDEMGFVRKDQLSTSNYVDHANNELNSFLEKHTEYLPENDKGGILWGAFKREYDLFKQPSNPKDFKKIFERVHRDVFGIKPAGPLKEVNAQQEKKQVASHAGGSQRPTAPAQRKEGVVPQGARLDMLKGFSEEEKAEMFGE